jgi:hypothetical protein
VLADASGWDDMPAAGCSSLLGAAAPAPIGALATGPVAAGDALRVSRVRHDMATKPAESRITAPIAASHRERARRTAGRSLGDGVSTETLEG